MATKNLKMSFIQTLINNKLYPQDTSEYQELLKDLGRMSLKNLKTLMDIVGSQVAEKMRATRATCEAVEKDPEHIAWTGAEVSGHHCPGSSGDSAVLYAPVRGLATQAG